MHPAQMMRTSPSLRLGYLWRIVKVHLAGLGQCTTQYIAYHDASSYKASVAYIYEIHRFAVGELNGDSTHRAALLTASIRRLRRTSYAIMKPHSVHASDPLSRAVFLQHCVLGKGR